MKTQIITLQSHDDLISVRDRLSWAKTPRILLVWPKGEPISLRSLDLKVLQRQAETLGAQLGIVTRRRWVRQEAEALGLPVFESSAAAQKEAWPAPAKRSRRAVRPVRRDLRGVRQEAMAPEAAWRSNPFARTIAFGLGVLAVLTLVSIFIPRATITLYPPSEQQSQVFPVAAGPPGEVVGTGETVPTRAYNLTLEGSQTVKITSHISVPSSTARGHVLLRNLTEKEVDIPSGTTVFAPGPVRVRFHTLQAVVLGPGPDEASGVPVEAAEAGAAGNQPAGAITSMEGPLGLLAAVTNPDATEGGTDRMVTGPDAQDRAALRASLLEELRALAATRMQAGLTADDLFLPDTLTAAQVVEENYEPPTGKAGTSLSLSLRVEFTARIVSQQDLRRVAEAVLSASAPQGLAPVPDSLTFGPASIARTDEDGIARWQIQAARRMMRRTDAAEVLEAVRGRSIQAARQELEGASSWDRPPELTLQPAWWPWMPLLPFRTSVVVQ
jgi:hypothetical protein